VSSLKKAFVQALDGIDNGISQYPTDVKPVYQSHTDLASRIGRLNPQWNDPSPDADACFMQAVSMAGEEFYSSLDYYSKVSNKAFMK